ncbi:MAG: hypothetical protein RLZZ303_2548 [Candidatus Hydrogenedentota bacterium]|jgi:glycosyltransferase involved in cell wall biosynthesis
MLDSAASLRFGFSPLPERPLVSVLLSSYNYASFLPEAIASVYAQSYGPLELIVVDDGSSDDSPAVIREWVARSPVPVETIFQPNGGQASAWNAGFSKCRGELVCLLDSDDTWRPGKVEAMVHLAQEYPEAGLYQHQLDNAAGQLKKPRLISRDILRDWMSVGAVDVRRRADLVAVYLPSTGLMARREVLEHVFPIPEQLITCPDAYLTRMCCLYGPLQSCDEVLGSWREHGQNAGKSVRFSFENYWLPTVMPAINEGFAACGVPVSFVDATPLDDKAGLIRRLLRGLR